MDDFNELAKSKRLNDRRGVQKALRQIDTNILAVALSAAPEHFRNRIYANMTVRSRAVIENEIELMLASDNRRYVYDNMTVEEAQAMVAHAITEYTMDGPERETVYPKELPEVRLGSVRDVIDTFEQLDAHSYRHGLMSLEGIEETVEDEYFKKAVQLLLDGWEPLLLEQLLENYKTRMLERLSIRMDMISQGIRSIQAGDPPPAVREKLSSLAPPE
jgi:hypothetical protein